MSAKLQFERLDDSSHLVLDDHVRILASGLAHRYDDIPHANTTYSCDMTSTNTYLSSFGPTSRLLCLEGHTASVAGTRMVLLFVL